MRGNKVGMLRHANIFFGRYLVPTTKNTCFIGAKVNVLALSFLSYTKRDFHDKY